MSEKRIHIVAFDVPYPADYGGAIDIYFRIKALYELGFKITLHCFEYGRGEQPHLDEITEKVFYYARQKTIFNAFNKRPFIVASRRSKSLLNRLLADNAPILFEGIHTTWFLENKEVQKRLTYVRTHNIEHDYYSALAKNAGGVKRLFFKQEARKLKNYEAILEHSTNVFCIREGDVLHFTQFTDNISVLPASTPELSMNAYESTEDYALFHGNLSVSENDEAAQWIIAHIWRKEKSLLPLKIAGKNPSQKLITLAQQNGIEVIANPSMEEMKEIISKAGIHVLVSDQSTGVKLKLLAAAGSSGHVLVNPTMVMDTNLTEVVKVCTSSAEFISKILEIQENALPEVEFEKRKAFLRKNYSTKENCRIFENT